MPHTPIIFITATEIHTVVSVADTELFDYLDDFFTERGLECACVSLAEPGQDRMHAFYFEPSCSPAMVRAALAQLPSSEIGRILCLNVTQTPAG